MSNFRINYSQVVGQADKIGYLSEDLESQAKNLQALYDDIDSSWTGKAATEYKKHLMILKQDLLQTEASMSRISSTIRNVAKRIHDEDVRLAEEARQLELLKSRRF